MAVAQLAQREWRRATCGHVDAMTAASDRQAIARTSRRRRRAGYAGARAFNATLMRILARSAPRARSHRPRRLASRRIT